MLRVDESKIFQSMFFVIGIVFCYFALYAVLRDCHVIVHFECVVFPNGHEVRAEHDFINVPFYPLIDLETRYHIYRSDAVWPTEPLSE